MHALLLDADIYDQIRETARRFAEEVVRPAAADLDRDETFPADIYRQMGALGLFGITVPEGHGGAGLDTYAYSIVMEELSRGYASVADQCGLVELIGTLLTRYGAPEQLKRLPGILAGKTRVAYCLTEAEAGSDLSNVRTTARETAEGYVIDGGKLWIHNAPVADLGFVLASTDPSAGHRGMSIFLVDLHVPGVSRGPKEHKMGQRASQVGALTFDGVTVPREALLGPKGRGFHIMMSVLEKGRVGIASLAVGIAQAGLEAALGYARDRRQFGKPILDNQGLQWLLADMAKDIAAARALVERAALLIDHEKPATSASSMAKCFASDMAVAQTANAVQVFGGSGYIRGFEVERLYRDAKITQIYEGTNQIQRTIIARELIKNGA
ncbi:acyl-CoA dehydrogenase family protein [Bosea sp. 47.2.35]|uniref:acyl-CoA dehydrogenase family protein n=1 Tax=Bosea TaxID=85413 RepID=UPI00215057F5|nr:acyl-CoA dehydrogenase family protein [Bosea sp. 47.2.35]MDR6828676.1 alkylation response protein AidB-like acyl-CoA dehydrogenase [Bosea robiniae]MDR6895335.1 alkylation response protein AidB-like acyl-CoA dehydrogenase [Bosea sp. BE109]MDR7138731.1 alkylation response protein AidB-like acyl-CoA dehydrogenase [Bosea sp. BE168]MDR7175294.1 alkylation response protein AidB-like acyl-CoA dehydrogenase [Bosea sp. BE271]